MAIEISHPIKDGLSPIEALVNWFRERPKDVFKAFATYSKLGSELGVEMSPQYASAAKTVLVMKNGLTLLEMPNRVWKFFTAIGNLGKSFFSEEKTDFKGAAWKSYDVVRAGADIGSESLDAFSFVDLFRKVDKAVMKRVGQVSGACLVFSQGAEVIKSTNEIVKTWNGKTWNKDIPGRVISHNFLVLARSVSCLALGVLLVLKFIFILPIASIWITLLSTKALVWSIVTYFHDEIGGYSAYIKLLNEAKAVMPKDGKCHVVTRYVDAETGKEGAHNVFLKEKSASAAAA